MEWEPIKQYEGKSELPGVSEMEALKLVWADYREYFGPEMTKSIQDRFNREWSIETGLIEGAYYIDKGITVTLVDQGIKASLIDRQQNGKSPEQVANILLDQVGAIEGLFAFVNGSSPLTTSYIRQLHQQLMRSEDSYTVYSPDGQPIQKALEKGKYKTQSNSPLRPDGVIHPYCPPEQVDGEMERLVKIYHEQLGLPVEVQAAWLHHAFTQIHPFQDGNGRVARALASLVLIKGGLLPMLVSREKRPQYIDSLESADRGEIATFIEFIRHCQRISIFKISNSLAQPSEMPSSTESSIDDIIGAIESDLILKDTLPRKQWLLDGRINQLSSIISNVLNGVMGNVLGRLGHGGHIRCEVSNAISNYLPTDDFGALRIKSVERLRLFRANQVMSLWFSFLVPEKLRGLAIVVPFVEFESPVQESLGEFFLINNLESPVDQDARLKLWLEGHVKTGLKRWRNTLSNN